MGESGSIYEVGGGGGLSSYLCYCLNHSPMTKQSPESKDKTEQFGTVSSANEPSLFLSKRNSFEHVLA